MDLIPRRTFLDQTGRAALGLAAFSAGVRPQQPDSVQTLITTLRAQVPQWMKAANVPGLSIAIIHNARVAWRQSFGVKDATTGEVVNLDTMFEAASMSKPVFAYIVMKLVEDGVIDLDTPLTKYTPDRFLQGDARLDLITARHVLSHTSGFQNWRSDTSPLAIHFTPGSKYQYSGEGYNYLQTVITRLLRQPYERYVRTRIFEPMRMKSSGYVWTDNIAKQMARPHNASGQPIEQNKSDLAGVARFGSAGALLTTPADYATLLINVISPPPADKYHLSPASIAEMIRPQVKLESSTPPSSWALGWQIFHSPDRDFIFHGGNNRGFHSASVASVAGKSGYVAMTNGDGGPQVLGNLLTSEGMQQFLRN